MARFTSFGSVLLILVCASCQDFRVPDAEPPAPANKAPDFTLATITGDSLMLSAREGKVLLLNFWGTWCEPCRHEQPILNDLYARYQGRGLEVWGIAVSSTRLAVELWIENLRVPYPILMSAIGDSTLLRRYGVDKGIPLSVLVDGNGEVHLEQQGVVTSADSLSAVIEILLGPSR